MTGPSQTPLPYNIQHTRDTGTHEPRRDSNPQLSQTSCRRPTS